MDCVQKYIVILYQFLNIPSLQFFWFVSQTETRREEQNCVTNQFKLGIIKQEKCIKKTFNNSQQTVTCVSTVIIFTIVTNGNAVTSGKAFSTVSPYDTKNTTTTETNVTMDNIITTTTNIANVLMSLLSFLCLKSPTNKLVTINMQLRSAKKGIII